MAPARAWPSRFHDRLGFRLPGTRDMVRIFREGGFNDPKTQLPQGRDVPRADAASVPRRERGVAVTWVGHASALLQVGGVAVLADPVWSERLVGGIKRATPPGVAWRDLPDVDALVVSHNHYDHLDAATVKRLPRATPVFAPAKLGAWFRAKGFSRVTDLDWWESAPLDGATLTLVPAQHWSRRTPWDTNATLWGGWVVQANGASAYFAGDSGYCGWFAEIGRRFPALDVAVLPIGAYEPRWFMRNVHANPEEAVQAFVDVGARRFVPMHWGTFPLTREPLTEPRARLLAEWARRGLPEDALWDLALGETREAAPARADEAAPA